MDGLCTAICVLCGVPMCPRHMGCSGAHDVLLKDTTNGNQRS